MRRFHIALGVKDIEESVKEYSRRLEAEPELIVPGQYALWRTDSLNLSIRKVDEGIGTVRHLGWEDESASIFTAEHDVNGLLWEHFSAKQQALEIRHTWTFVEYEPDSSL